jgi:hypothetical protein
VRSLLSTHPCPRPVARNRVGHVIHEAHWQRYALTPARGWGGRRRCRVDMGKQCQYEGGCKKGVRSHNLCAAHGGGKRCQFDGCAKLAQTGGTQHCSAHGGGRRCQHDGCAKAVQGSTQLCIAHGGGKRCTYDGCAKAAQGSTQLCIAHGGGRRCQYDGCAKAAHGSTQLCIAHGGGKRCTYGGCVKAAQPGGTQHCIAHGGGKRCKRAGCTKLAARGGTQHCRAHGGGLLCVPAADGVSCIHSAVKGYTTCYIHGGGYMGAGRRALFVQSVRSKVFHQKVAVRLKKAKEAFDLKAAERLVQAQVAVPQPARRAGLSPRPSPPLWLTRGSNRSAC